MTRHHDSECGRIPCFCLVFGQLGGSAGKDPKQACVQGYRFASGRDLLIRIKCGALQSGTTREICIG